MKKKAPNLRDWGPPNGSLFMNKSESCGKLDTHILTKPVLYYVIYVSEAMPPLAARRF